jgi:hypothetical protein
MKDTIAVSLPHFCVNVETRIPKLCDLFRQEFNTVDRIAENNRLVDLKLRASGLLATTFQ